MIKLSKEVFRILIYSDHFWPSIGGSENYVIDLANELHRQGLKVGVITAEKSFENDKFQFEIYRLKRPFSIKRMNINFLEVIHIIKTFRPHIFHINYQTGGENIIIPIVKFMKIPIVITYHADHVVLLGRLIDAFQMVSVFRLASVVMVQSEHDAKRFKERRFSDTKLKYLRFNGIDTSRYCCIPRERDIRNPLSLLCIGRLDNGHKYKGVLELITSLIELKQFNNVLNIKLTIIGDGELRESYQNECLNKGMDNITFLGNLDDDKVIDTLCKTDFLILPSINHAEGFGRVALEAISCGTPIIVSKYAGISELIIKYNAGIVYDPNEFNLLVNKIKELINNHSKINEFVSNGKKLIEHEGLSLTSTTLKMVKIYKQVKINDN